MPKIFQFPNPLKHFQPATFSEQMGDERQKLGLLRYPDILRGDMTEVKRLRAEARRLKKQIIDFATQF